MNLFYFCLIAALTIVAVYGLRWYLLIKAEQRKLDEDAKRCKYKVDPRPKT